MGMMFFSLQFTVTTYSEEMKRFFTFITVAIVVAGLVLVAACGQQDTVFRIDLIKYLDNSYTRSFEDTLRRGLAEAGLEENRDYRLRSRSAQGDMASLTMLIDAAVSARADLLITFQAPTLYTAIQRAPGINKAFTLVQNPFIIGAGVSDDDHAPDLTGLYMVPPLEELLDVIGQCRPVPQSLGVIFDPGDADSTYRKDELIRLATMRGFTVHAVPYTSSHEIATAVEALLALRPDGLVHLNDPAQDVTFPALYRNASRRRLPVFSVVHNMHLLGAAIICVADREEVGLRFGRMVARIVQGELPGDIPFANDRDLPKRFGYNRTVASDIRLTLPESLAP